MSEDRGEDDTTSRERRDQPINHSAVLEAQQGRESHGAGDWGSVEAS